MKLIIFIICGGLFFSACSSLSNQITTNTSNPEKDLSTTSENTPHTLRFFAEQNDFLIGSQIGGWTIQDYREQEIAPREFNGATIDFDWAEIEPELGEYHFEYVDSLVQFAIQNKMKITGLHLLWGNYGHLPNWLLDGEFSDEELRDILHDYIVALAGRYKGKIFIWSVANEFTNGQIWGGDFWYDNLGKDYVELAYKWARETDPDALLMANNDANESTINETNASIVSLMLSLLEEWKDDDIPIDVVGMQMHLLAPFSSTTISPKQEVMETMQKYADLGYKVYITEFDVNINDIQGNQEERWDYQAEIYAQMLEACIESGVCKGFSTFGISDPRSWYTSLNFPNAEPLLFDGDYKPKPAYHAILNVLQSMGS